jgi:ABC-type multidrug transport system ATPase subunit
VETICKHVVILDGGRQIAAGDIATLLIGEDRIRVDVRGDRDAFVRQLRDAGYEAEAGATGVRVARKPGVEADVFRVAKALGAEIRYLGAEIRSLEELFLELVERSAGGTK